MAIITTGYVNLAIGTSTRAALAPTTAAFDQYQTQATVTVQSKAAVAGYSITTNDTNDFVKQLVLGQWYVKALGWRKGMALPPNVAVAVNDLELVSTGDLPIPGKSPNARDAIGGVKFSAASATARTGRFAFFSRGQFKGNW